VCGFVLSPHFCETTAQASVANKDSKIMSEKKKIKLHVQATHTLFEKSGICADDKNRIMHIVNILAFVLKPKYLLVLRLYIEDDYLSAKRLILHMSCLSVLQW